MIPKTTRTTKFTFTLASNSIMTLKEFLKVIKIAIDIISNFTVATKKNYGISYSITLPVTF